MNKKTRNGLKKTVSWMLSLVLISGFFTLASPLNAAAATPSWTGTGSSAPYCVYSMVELNGTIYAGAKDGSGIWTCSNGVWTPMSGAPSTIFSMVKGADGTIYVGYQSDYPKTSVLSYYNGTWTELGHLPSLYPFSLLIKKDGTLCVATPDGVYTYNNGTAAWSQISPECTRSLAEGAGGTLYAGRNDGVWSYSGGSWTQISIVGAGKEIPQSLAYVNGTLYISDDSGVLSYDGSSCTIMPGSPTLVNAIAEINGTLYAGSYDGLYTYSGGIGGTWTKIPDSPSYVISLLYANGTIYAGTDLETWRCSNGVWTMAAPGKINAILAIGNAVYTGTDVAVWRYSNGSWAQMSGSPARVTCMQNVDGTLYAGAYDGVWSYSSGTWTKMSGSPARVTCMLSKAIGLLNVGTSDGQLWSYNDFSGPWTWAMLADKLEINNTEGNVNRINSLMYKSFIYVGGESGYGTGDVWIYYGYKFHLIRDNEPGCVVSVVELGTNNDDFGVVSQGHFYKLDQTLGFVQMSNWPTVSKATNMGGTVYAWGEKVWRYNGGESWTELSGAPRGVNWMAYLNGTPYAGANGLYLYTAPSAPTIGSQPADRTVTAGGTAAFTIAAASNDGWVLSYQWQNSTDGGGNWSNVAGGAGATTDSYTTGTLSTADSGTLYRCIVTDSIGGPIVSNPATLTVSTAPAFTPVTDITGVPTTATAGTQIDLTGASVTPADATNKTIVWTVKDAGTTGVTTAALATGKFTPSGAGTLVLTATVANGLTSSTSYTQDFTITVSTVPVTPYTITFNSNGSVYTTKTVNAGESIGNAAWPADPTRSSYTFGGWFTGENGSGTQFTSATPVNAATTVYAKWTYSGGGGGGSPSGGGSTAPATYNADIDGSNTKLPVTVSQNSSNARVDVGTVNGLMSDGKTTVITVPTIPDVNAYTLGIPVQSLSMQNEHGALAFKTDMGTVTVPSNMLFGVAGADGKKAEITIGQGDKSTLPDDVKAAIGDRPLISLSLSVDGKQTDWSNPNAPVTVSIPYTPTAAELANPEGIIIWYIDGSGNLVSIPNGHYDPATGKVTFTTTHFSTYAVGYNKVSFSDVADTAWYSDAVGFIAARGITAGTGNGNFSPDAKLTRGEFIVMLMKAYGIAPDAAPTGNFADAGSTYYTGYLAAAKRLGITTGIGNNMYAPAKEVTRQEMFTLLYNALKSIGSPLIGDAALGVPSGKALSDFTDAGDIASWAKDAMTLLVKTGIIGGSGGKLNPAGTTTRAEMAQVLYNLLYK